MPDYLLLTDDGPVVVDVKPRSQLDEPKVKFILDWTRTLVERRGWRYEVWSEPPATELETVRFLAGFRNAERFDPELISAPKARDDLKGRTLAHAFCEYRVSSSPKTPHSCGQCSSSTSKRYTTPARCASESDSG